MQKAVVNNDDSLFRISAIVELHYLFYNRYKAIFQKLEELAPRSWFLMSFSNERNQGSMEDEGRYKMSLCRSKGSTQKATPYVKGTKEAPGKMPSGQSWKNVTNKINKVILDRNSKYKVNISEPVLI